MQPLSRSITMSLITPISFPSDNRTFRPISWVVGMLLELLPGAAGIVFWPDVVAATLTPIAVTPYQMNLFRNGVFNALDKASATFVRVDVEVEN